MYWQGIPIYPTLDESFKNSSREYIKHVYQDFKADFAILHIDIGWVLPWFEAIDGSIDWVYWLPIDHSPLLSLEIESIKNAPGLISPIAVSQYGQAELKKEDIDSYYIPHGIDTNLFSPNEVFRNEARRLAGWEDKFVVGTVGVNHQERKQLGKALHGFKLFADKHDDVVYYLHTNVIDPKGLDLQALQRNLGIEKKCYAPSLYRLKTGVSKEEMAQMYNALDVFLLPSAGEGFGLPIIEAQACGVPVIINNNTAMPELLGGGWLIDKQVPSWTPANYWRHLTPPEAIAEMLEQAYQEKKSGAIKTRQAQARKKALEYDEQKILKEYWVPTLEKIDMRIKFKDAIIRAEEHGKRLETAIR